MEIVTSILTQLGVNNTFYYQFAIICVLYFISSKFLFVPLQKVLDLRAEKTTKTEKLAGELNEKYKNLKYEYDEKLERTHKSVQENKTNQKKEIERELEYSFKDKESEINDKLDTQKNIVEKEYLSKKNDILGESKNLADELIKRVHG